MRLLILTGMSGAGKSTALKMLERSEEHTLSLIHI